MSKKNKFDLTRLVHDGLLKEGQTLFFVSDPSKTCKIVKHPSGEYKVAMGAETLTVHTFAEKCLAQDPPGHGAKWVRNEAGKSLFDLWHANDEAAAA